MMRDGSVSGRSLIHLACVIAGLLPFALLDDASADEAGVSFWLQGQFGSFAAVPSEARSHRAALPGRPPVIGHLP